MLSAKPSPGGEHQGSPLRDGGGARRRRRAARRVSRRAQGCFREKLPEENKARGAPALAASCLGTRRARRRPGKPSCRRKYERRPVFAMVSGLGADEWAPVERFCEADSVPCLFPNVEVPGSPEGGRYSFYFYRGALLEADVMACHLTEQSGEARPARGWWWSAAPTARAPGRRPQLQERLKAGEAPGGASRTGRIRPQVDAIRATAGTRCGRTPWLCCLPEADLADVGEARRQRRPRSGHAAACPACLAGWRTRLCPRPGSERLLMTYPFDPPVRWNRRMDFNLRTWLSAERAAAPGRAHAGQHPGGLQPAVRGHAAAARPVPARLPGGMDRELPDPDGQRAGAAGVSALQPGPRPALQLQGRLHRALRPLSPDVRQRDCGAA
ncbi:MAG: hypothetical protein MZW92_76355 [Comamonadaceae bacterium]|nr:hypothetical protein [Comamonadaceae bacterium]